MASLLAKINLIKPSKAKLNWTQFLCYTDCSPTGITLLQLWLFRVFVQFAVGGIADKGLTRVQYPSK
jgi:hypothetical protein